MFILFDGEGFLVIDTSTYCRGVESDARRQNLRGRDVDHFSCAFTHQDKCCMMS